MSTSLIVNESSINSPNECSSVLVNESLPSIKIDNFVGPSTVVPLNPNNVSMCNNDQPSLFSPKKESNLPKQAASPPQQDCITFQSPQINGLASLLQAMSGSASSMLINSSYDKDGMPFCPGPLSLTTSPSPGDSSVADYQVCGLSSVFLAGESSSLDPSFPQARDKAKMRYNEKKKIRMFGKHITYAFRKARVDTRKRVKWRFVKKISETYDYTPLGTRI